MMHREVFGIVYSNKKYIYASIAIFAGLFFSLSLVSEFIFLSPVFVFYVQPHAITDFALVVAISILSGIVTSFSIFRMRMSNSSLKKSSAGFVGSIIGASAGACSSCGPLGFSIIPIFGTIGGTAAAFLTNYEMPLRLASIAILCFTYYASAKDITAKCKIIK